jgi:peroxiredoxin
MSLAHSTVGGLGSAASAFKLRGVDGKFYQLSDFQNGVQKPQAIVIVFMCNHCPYVIAVQDRINALAKEYLNRNVQFLGINSNDSTKYPADGFEAMKVRAREQNFVFPYLWDESQEVAKAYGAVCTPEFYLYGVTGSLSSGSVDSAKTHLDYKGRLDDSWKDPAQVTRQDLKQALEAVLKGEKPDPDQKPAMGCSIKWRDK